MYSYSVMLLEILSGWTERHRADGQRQPPHWSVRTAKKMGSHEPEVNILGPKMRGMPDQLVQEMPHALGIAIFWVKPALEGGCGLPQGGEE